MVFDAQSMRARPSHATCRMESTQRTAFLPKQGHAAGMPARIREMLERLVLRSSTGEDGPKAPKPRFSI